MGCIQEHARRQEELERRVELHPRPLLTSQRMLELGWPFRAILIEGLCTPQPPVITRRRHSGRKQNLSQGHTSCPEPFQAGTVYEAISSSCSVDGICFCTDGVYVDATTLSDTRGRQGKGRKGKENQKSCSSYCTAQACLSTLSYLIFSVVLQTDWLN